MAEEGSLSPLDYPFNQENNPNANFNIWNLDLKSEAVLLYHNAIFNRDKLSYLQFNESLDNLFVQPSRHNLSLRLVYFIDYNRVRNLFQS